MNSLSFKLLIITLCAALAGMVCICSGPAPLAGGGGTETIIGKVVYSDGNAAPRTEVVLLPGNYNPVTGRPALDHPFIDTTNDSGIYRFAEVKYGGYSIQALHLDSLSRALHSGIAVAKDAVPVLLDTLRIPGTIMVFRPDSADTANGYLYIPGTDIAVPVGSGTGAIIIDSVPAGIILSVNYTVSSGSIQQVIRYDVPVPSGDTVIVANPAWKYSKRIYCNTFASGANVPGNVTGFPVLVRLTGSNFIFTEAKSDGSDLRFAKPDNTPLPYEIERWDPITELAEVWVRIDTIVGDDSTQYFTMFWGDSGAVDASNSAAVFDTGNGFQGVWHLKESSGSSAGEATGNGYTGSYNGALPRSEDGEISICQSLVDSGDFADMGNVLDAGSRNLSVSAWIRTGTAYVQFIAGKSNGDNPSATYGYLFTINLNNRPHIHLASGGAAWGDAGTFDVGANVEVTDTNWHYVCAVLDRSGNSNCRMYVDGVDRTDTTRGDITSVGNASNVLNFRIGAQSNGRYPFTGSIDEVVVGYTVRSADWVKLCYMNQKSSDALLKIDH